METDKNKHETVDEYIAAFPKDIQELLEQIRTAIRSAAPGAVEKISYGMPTLFLKKNLVHFAAFKNHIGFYPTPSGTGNFAKELSAYKTSKGAVQFPYGKPLPLDLISRITAYRVSEVM